ncbi:carbon-nitrogen hydrolase family protein [Pseudactinotalea suaedae]|uniref:carbon-nitrogen hydrolase family protein n=1 Tax=Pseudactinotalea suaedae TaxID=1524924 RepID=UPI0012E1D598|nr:carbon-nitrogen hydrolase family protein [Pseudactinotalea suaedae]
MTDLRIAVGQYAATEDHEANAAIAVGLVAQAAEAGARLVLLPEYALAWAPRLHAGLGDGHAAFADALAGAARAHGVWVVAGTLEPAGGRLLNVAIALGPDGRRRAAYTKVHLFDAFGVRESDVLDAGAPGQPVVIDVDGWQVGLATCYDLRFPETFRLLVDAGAQVLAVGAAWAAGPGKADQLKVLARARALENTSYLLLASQSGEGRTGRSAAVGPLGERLSEAGETPELLVVDLSRQQLNTVRERVPSLQHRRYRVVPSD